MYLSAHRVYSRALDQRAVHAFLYRPDAAITGDPTERDLERLAEDPGQLVASRFVLPPGGNEVESYLDIVARDGLEVRALEAVVCEARAQLAANDLPTITVPGAGAVLRFYGRRDDRVQTLKHLWGVARELWTNPVLPEPFTVEVTRTATGRRFELDGASARRVANALAAPQSPPSVSMDDDVAGAFTELHGGFYEELVPVLTGLALHQVIALGGIRFESADGTQLWSSRPA